MLIVLQWSDFEKIDDLCMHMIKWKIRINMILQFAWLVAILHDQIWQDFTHACCSSQTESVRCAREIAKLNFYRPRKDAAAKQNNAFFVAGNCS